MQTTIVDLKVKVVKGCDCGMQVYRLLIWLNGRLVLLRTHASKEGAISQWLQYKANPARLQALSEVSC